MTPRDERKILDRCAAAFAGVKSGSLLKVDRMVCNDTLELLSSFENKDVGTKLLCPSGSSFLILVYRRRMLEVTLKDRDTAEFLRGMGYDGSMSEMLDRLSKRMCENIQHELGIFLGYPLCDVKGFMENRGNGYKLSGCWKVYGDTKMAERVFARIKVSRRNCLRMYDAGLSFRTVVSAF